MVASTAAAQTSLALVKDGQIGCVGGMTGMGRPQAWRAVRDEGGPDGWALVETAGDATDLRFPLCMLPGGLLRDVEATLTLRLVGGTRAQAGGLVLRAQDAAIYYVVVASALDKSVRLYRMQNGRRAGVAGKEAAVTLGKWHRLTVRLEGDKFDVSLDGAPVFSATDRSLTRPGVLGIWSQSDSVTHFGAVELKPPP